MLLNANVILSVLAIVVANFVGAVWPQPYLADIP